MSKCRSVATTGLHRNWSFRGGSRLPLDLRVQYSAFQKTKEVQLFEDSCEEGIIGRVEQDSNNASDSGSSAETSDDGCHLQVLRRIQKPSTSAHSCTAPNVCDDGASMCVHRSVAKLYRKSCAAAAARSERVSAES